MSVRFVKIDTDTGTVSVLGDGELPDTGGDWPDQAARFLEALDPELLSRRAVQTSSMKDDPATAVVRVLVRTLRGDEGGLPRDE